MVDIRSKIIEFLCAAHSKVTETSAFGKELTYAEALGIEADYLIASGVTVGKPLIEHLHPVDAYEGLKGKYLVFKADTGEQIVNCFVLRPEKDTAAVEALRTYANTTDNETLATDIYNWVGHGETAQKWIPVSERLPEEHKSIFAGCYGTNNWMAGMFRTVSNTVIAAVLYEDGKRFAKAMHTQDGKWHHPGMVGVKEVTHWMPLPEPPKEVE